MHPPLLHPLVWLALLLGLLPCVSSSGATPRTGQIMFKETFEGDDLLNRLNAPANTFQAALGYTNGQALQVSIPASAARAGGSIRIPISIGDLRGARVRCEAMVKATNVIVPPKPWNGIKVMLHITSPAGDLWPQQNNIHGSFDWKRVQFDARVPRDATEAEIVLGLEAVSGTATFDELRLMIVRPPRPSPVGRPAGPPFKGHDLERLRGGMIGHVNAADLREFGKGWGANHVRWQLLWGGFPHSPADNGDLNAYDRWMEGELKRLDELIPVCREAGIKVLIDVHTPPGGRNEAKECRLFHEARFQQNFLSWWDRISRRYRSNETVWGYDLVNEPVQGSVGDGCMDWQALALAAARTIRTNDATHAIVVEPEPWGGPESMENLEPLPIQGVVYSAHMYVPHKFTHQGVYDEKSRVEYPGVIDGIQWDKERLRKALQPVIDFQRAYNVHIYIGEFSAIRWAPGESAHRYLKDCIEIFEEQGWDWAYHAYREWDGWSVEHGSDKNDRKRSSSPTSRETLLRHWFKKNQREE